MKPPILTSTMLPADAREILQRASATAALETRPLKRAKVMEAAQAKVRSMYPQFFQPLEN